MVKRHKVVIVGAGPAGLRCAKILAENNIDVVVFERKPKLDRKICTGFWGLNEKINNLKLPQEVIEKKFNEVILSTPFKKSVIKIKKPFVATINRKKLSEWMLKQAEKAGARVIFNSPVSEIKDNYIIAKNKKINFDYLVGADGSSSIVRQHLGLKNKLGVAVQYWVKRKFDAPELHFDADKFALGYYWIAPYKNKTCIGAGASIESTSALKIKQNLDSWCKERKIDLKDALYEGAPINFDYQGYKFGNIFLIGDAAGFPSELTGAGIYSAIASGEDVAKLISDKNYPPKAISWILNLKEKHELIAKALSLNKNLEKIEFDYLSYLLKFKLFDEELIKLIC